MLYIDYKNTDKGIYGVADTDDGIIETYTEKGLKAITSHGLVVSDWDFIKQYVTPKMIRTCNYNLWRKLRYISNEEDLIPYLKKYSIYNITDVLNKYKLWINFNKGCEVFKYDEVFDYFLVTLTLSDNSILVLKINSEYNITTIRLDDINTDKNIISCAGFVTKKVLKNFDFSSISDSETYLVFHSKDNKKLYYIKHKDLSKTIIT